MQFKDFFQRFYPYLKSNMSKLILVSITIILATILEASLPEITGRIVDNFHDKDTTLFYSLLVFFVIFISSAFAFIATNISSLVANRVIMDLRVKMFANLLRLPKAYFDKTDNGKIISKLTFDVEQISSMASIIWMDLLKYSIMVIVLLGYLFWTSWQLSLSLLVVLPLIAWAVKKSSLRIKNASEEVQNSMGNATNTLSESIGANAMVKIYGLFKPNSTKFNSLVNTIRVKKFRVDNVSAINTFFVNTLIGISLGLVVYFSANNLDMSAGEFMAFFTSMGMLIKPAKSLVNINKPLQQALAAGGSVFGLLDEKIEIDNNKEQNIKGEIEFKNVSFSYNQEQGKKQDEKQILTDISFSIDSGQSLGLVGATGSGKSTIAQLITRFYAPCGGEILIDGVDIKQIGLKILRANIALVEQKVNLFTGTIAENINPCGDLNNAQIKQSLKDANAFDFVENLKNKEQSQIGNNAVQLSGGQAQRLSIARAIAKNAPILILDEATSALDSKTEQEVQQAIDNLQVGKTTIIIAHRLSTIQNCDKIAVIKDGKIAEIGSHQELIAKNGQYNKLYNFIT